VAPPASAPIVRCRHTVKEFRQANAVVQALRGVDLDVAAGQVTVLVGPSGCGKTTLLSVVVGLLTPTSGEVTVLGTEITRLSQSQKTRFRRELIGFVFQHFHLLPGLTAVENAAVPLWVAGWPSGRALRRAAEVLESVGLSHRSESLPAQLSGGEQQRVAIARALVHGPKLVVCDEPTSTLDAATGLTVMELLRDVALQPDRAVLVVTHDPRVHPFADRIVSMEDGRITRVEDGSPGRK
jgi:putative ABC transport system ATP-binding protein